MRYTPAGIPAVEFKLRHESEQAEAGGKRNVIAEMPAIAFESLARLIAAAKPGAGARLEGFLAPKTKRSKRLVLHVTNIEFIEGT